MAGPHMAYLALSKKDAARKDSLSCGTSQSMRKENFENRKH